MKQLLAITLSLTALFCSQTASADPIDYFAPWLSNSSNYSDCSSEEINFSTLERRGCCSWHGGICGCSHGQAMCCDGSASPTCTC